MANGRVFDVSDRNEESFEKSLVMLSGTTSLQRSTSLPSLPWLDVASGKRFHENSLSVDLSASMEPKSTQPMLNSKSPSRQADENGMINIRNAASIMIGNKELESLKTKELKRELIARGLDGSGKKPALVDRLRKFIQTSRQIQNLDGNQINQANRVNTTGQRPIQHDCPCSTQIGDLKSEIEQIKKTLNMVSDGEVVVVKSSEQSNRVAKLEEENRTLRLHLASIKDQNSQLVEERDSLKLAIQLLSKDLHQLHSSKNQEIDFIPKSRTVKSPSIEQNQSNSECDQATPSPLGDDNYFNNNECDQARRTLEVKRSKKKKINSVNRDGRKEVCIVGDSILKNIQGWKMSSGNCKVKVSSFPGCTTEDMEDHIKPILRRKPHEVILHVGTNSLRSSTSERACAEQIVDLATNVVSQSVKVSISAIVCRSDDNVLARKALGVNKIIKRFANQNGWSFIDHSSITPEEHLNRSGLHLNAKGTAQLAMDFNAHIKSN